MELNELILEELKDWKQDLLDRISPIDNMDEVAENHGFKLYGGDGFSDNALVINVKGMPDIDAAEVGEINDEIFWNKIEQQVEIFAHELEDKYEDFTIRGRMGGYWGLSNVESHLIITENGYKQMVKKVVELLNNPQLMYKEELDAAKNEADLKSVIYDVVNLDTQEIANVLVIEDDTIDIEPEFLEKMKKLKEEIFAKEKEMGTKEYWDALKELKEDINTLSAKLDDAANNLQDLVNTVKSSTNESVDEDINSLTDKVDNATKDLEELKKNLKSERTEKSLTESLNEAILEAVGDDLEIVISDEIDRLGFTEQQGAGMLQFVREGNYKHVITFDDQLNELKYEVFKDNKKIQGTNYRLIVDVDAVEKAFKEIEQTVEGME